jgi:hypothetical protein
MSDLIKLVPKANQPETDEFSVDDYYQTMEELKPTLKQILTISYDNTGELIVVSNGVDARTALWMAEEFKFNCLSGSFADQ